MKRRNFVRLALGSAGALCLPIPRWGGAEEFPQPFELSRALRALAAQRSTTVLDAGTGNPNYLHQDAREALVALTQLAQRTVGSGLVQKGASAPTFLGLLASGQGRGVKVLRAALETVRSSHSLEELVSPLCQMALGNTYAGTFSITKTAAGRYLKECVLRSRPDFELEVLPTQGASDAIRGIFRMFLAEERLAKGDRVAILTPTFSPSLLLPEASKRIEWTPIRLNQEPGGSWVLSSEELSKLGDPRVKVLFLVDPGNPVPNALKVDEVERLAAFIRRENPRLTVVTDLVYAGLTEDSHPLLTRLPRQTLGVGSWSKHFGATGWRLGAVVAHPEFGISKRLNRFVGRLCEPQQAALTLFSLVQLTDYGRAYQVRLTDELSRRWEALYKGLEQEPPRGSFCKFFALVDLTAWGGGRAGSAEAELEGFRKLARRHSVVVIPGRCFSGPHGSARVSLASLDVEACAQVGRALRSVFSG